MKNQFVSLRKITEYNSNVDNDQRGYTSNKIYNR